MGKKKTFDSNEVLLQVGQLFITNGYNGTSIGDIVEETGLLRGSLYATFGSKQGMFTSALKLSLERDDERLKWGLLIVAMLEVTPRNHQVFEIVQNWYRHQSSTNVATNIGTELLKHSGILGGEK
ncbi:hypothetical protein LPAF129_19350 [Ligilactobacillus pabuli]|uniref:HTH tetR-type domain-containing protein n=1 Tax=Ligilactobacillus pabuli TaxID=2886039 RepID=A0ABQ5JJM2_9LACO|nr:TetR/AcrR family transcriptional regulator [Ligilactobacillus pabuli]GKS82249.1 hypothetical protein LPAF129_19350 [Ligilactobacillus pabuli]HIW89667.1 TetR/AcrR family transcriptional regulator [Candidatus Ligilactobacillus excrementipullorum]